MPTLKAAAVWLVILGGAILNGALREAVLLPSFGTPVAPMLSGALLSIIVLGIAWLAAPWFDRAPPAHPAHVGAVWLALTLVFEFAFGRLVQKQDWDRLLEAYTFKDGNLWPLVLLVTAVAPWLAARLRGPT